MENKITEQFVVNQIIDYMMNLEKGNWHREKIEKSNLHEHGVDIELVGGKKNGEYFFIECKGKSYAKSARSWNKETSWIHALGQVITRMEGSRISISKDNTISGINRSKKYGVGLYWEAAQVALRRISKETAQILNLYIFAVNDKGEVKRFTPSQVGKSYPDEIFQ